MSSNEFLDFIVFDKPLTTTLNFDSDNELELLCIGIQIYQSKNMSDISCRHSDISLSQVIKELKEVNSWDSFYIWIDKLICLNKYDYEQFTWSVVGDELCPDSSKYMTCAKGVIIAIAKNIK